MSVIRRKPGTKRASTIRAASWRWVVYARQNGQPRKQGTYDDPNVAARVAREIRRDCGLAAWVRRAS